MDKDKSILDQLKRTARPDVPKDFFQELPSLVHDRIDYGTGETSVSGVGGWLKWLWSPALGILVLVAVLGGLDHAAPDRVSTVGSDSMASFEDERILDMVEEQEMVEYLAVLEPLGEGDQAFSDDDELDYLLDEEDFYYISSDSEGEISEEVMDYLLDELDEYEIYSAL